MGKGTGKEKGCESMSKFVDLTGQRFGKLLVLGIAEPIINPSGQKTACWKCKCDCGNVKIIRGTSLKSGRSTSCGCAFSEIMRKRKTTHGKSKGRLYHTYYGMKSRCNNQNDKSYANYGGRGIKVCEEWENDFEVFYKWALENGYNEDLSIDRINNDFGYSPENCRWVNGLSQARNKQSTRYLTHNGETKALSEWAEAYGISVQMLAGRLKRGWDVYKALTTPPKK